MAGPLSTCRGAPVSPSLTRAIRLRRECCSNAIAFGPAPQTLARSRARVDRARGVLGPGGRCEARDDRGRRLCDTGAAARGLDPAGRARGGVEHVRGTSVVGPPCRAAQPASTPAFERLLRRGDPLLRRIGYERLEAPVAAVERGVKGLLFDCRMCGQCALGSTGLSCPMNCPKNLRNGPCGGVRPDGMCEVLPAMRCVWVEAWQGSRRLRGRRRDHGGAEAGRPPPVGPLGLARRAARRRRRAA